MSQMSSSRPYLVAAIYDWIIDNNCTPYILVDATFPHTQVPTEYVQEGRIVLNIAPSAVINLNIGSEAIDFGGRFSGVARSLYVPMDALQGIYARENGQGILFNGPETMVSPGEANSEHGIPAQGDAGSSGSPPSGQAPKAASPTLSAVPGKAAGEQKPKAATDIDVGKQNDKSKNEKDDGDKPEPPPTSPGGGRPSLKVVK